MARKIITNNLTILALLINFIITSLLFLSSPELLLLLLLLFHNLYVIVITIIGLYNKVYRQSLGPIYLFIYLFIFSVNKFLSTTVNNNFL